MTIEEIELEYKWNNKDIIEIMISPSATLLVLNDQLDAFPTQLNNNDEKKEIRLFTLNCTSQLAIHVWMFYVRNHGCFVF